MPQPSPPPTHMPSARCQWAACRAAWRPGRRRGRQRRAAPAACPSADSAGGGSATGRSGGIRKEACCALDCWQSAQPRQWQQLAAGGATPPGGAGSAARRGAGGSSYTAAFRAAGAPARGRSGPGRPAKWRQQSQGAMPAEEHRGHMHRNPLTSRCPVVTPATATAHSGDAMHSSSSRGVPGAAMAASDRTLQSSMNAGG